MDNTYRKERIPTLKKILISAVIVFSVFFLIICVGEFFKYDSGLEKTFRSPSGDKEVTVKQDYVSRPDVYYKDECIFEYQRSGFNESVGWDVQWISDDEILLYVASPAKDKYADEKYTIEIPKN